MAYTFPMNETGWQSLVVDGFLSATVQHIDWLTSISVQAVKPNFTCRSGHHCRDLTRADMPDWAGTHSAACSVQK
jgi:hypothetical protein